MFTTVKTSKDVFFRDMVMMICMVVVVVVVVMKSRISVIPYRTVVCRTFFVNHLPFSPLLLFLTADHKEMVVNYHQKYKIRFLPSFIST